jgi:beta-galactosidase
MDRREFLRTTGTLIAGASVVPGLQSSSTAGSSAAHAGRTVLPINRNWRFSPKASPAARERNFDDSGFVRVVVPHTKVI